jgi:hypothetical protein
VDTFSRKQILLRVDWPVGSPTPLCLACGSEIEQRAHACRINLGPGGNPVARALCLVDEPYEAVVGWVHWACATGDRDNEQEHHERADGFKRQWLEDGDDYEPLDCHSCRSKIVASQSFVLIPLGPGRDAELQDKAQAGEFYTAVALPAHWRCATGDAEPEGDACALCRAELGADKACHNSTCDLNVGPEHG